MAGLPIATATQKFLSPGKAARLHRMESSWAIFTTTLVAMQITGDRRRPVPTMGLCMASFIVSAVAGGKIKQLLRHFLILHNRHKVMMY